MWPDRAKSREQKVLLSAVEQYLAARARGDVRRAAIARVEISQALDDGWGISAENKLLADLGVEAVEHHVFTAKGDSGLRRRASDRVLA